MSRQKGVTSGASCSQTSRRRRSDGSLMGSSIANTNINGTSNQTLPTVTMTSHFRVYESKTTLSEKTPLITSSTAIGAAAESLVNTSVVGTGGDLHTGVSWRMAAFLLVNTALGAGMLNYPYAYNQIGGVLAAGLMQVALLIFIASTMFILVYCADFNQDDTYHDVLLSMCGKRAQQISAMSILLTCYGINITFLVIIGDQYDRIFNSILTPEQLETYWWLLNRKFTIFLTSSLFIWPMCYAQRLDFLRHASVLGMFAMLYVAFLTVYEHYKLDDEMIDLVLSSLGSATSPQHGLAATAATTTAPLVFNSTTFNTNSTPLLLESAVEQGTNLTAATTTTTTAAAATEATLPIGKHIQWFEPLAIVPVLCFAYQTHEVIVPVYACMKERAIGNFMKASIFGLVILFALYNLVGAFGFLTFGDRVGPDIMSLYDAKDPVVVVGIVALVVKFITTYPPLMFCGRSALDGLYGELRKMSTNEFKTNEPRRRYVITTGWFISSVAIAIFAPDISITLQLLGSMASINVFVFPGMCLVSLTRRLRRARICLLMGELPEGCVGPATQQSAKDFNLISGSGYFGAAMRQSQSVSARNLCRNSCGNAAAYLSCGAGCGSCVRGLAAAASHQQQQQFANNVANNCAHCARGTRGAGLIDTTNTKQFTATFESLIELENGLDSGFRNSNDETKASNSNPLLLNGKSNANGFLSASFSTPSTSASSSTLSSTGGNSNSQLTHNNHNINDERQQQQQQSVSLVVNGNGSGSNNETSNNYRIDSNHELLATRQLQENVQRRQDGFERLLTTSGSLNCNPCCCSCTCSYPPISHHSLITRSLMAGSTNNSLTSKQQTFKATRPPPLNGPSLSHHLSKSINDSYEDYTSEYNDQVQQQYQLNNYNQYYQRHRYQQQCCNHYLQQQQQQQHNHHSQMTIDESHQIRKHHDALEQDKRVNDHQLKNGSYHNQHHQHHHQEQEETTAAQAGKSSLRHNHSNNHDHCQKQCLQTNSIHDFCQRSTTGSILDKFGTSIAPSTVAQIGISRCTATGLYSYAALLIMFGVFIFVLELVTVFGLL